MPFSLGGYEGTPLEDAGTVDPEDHAVLLELARLRAEAHGRRSPCPFAWEHLVVDEGDNQPLPIGAVVIQDNRIIGRGYNQIETLQDPTAHAEMVAMRRFLAENPRLIAFYATHWNGRDYATGALFTLRSADDKPLKNSAAIRVFHAFGQQSLAWRGKSYEVKREEVIKPALP